MKLTSILCLAGSLLSLKKALQLPESVCSDCSGEAMAVPSLCLHIKSYSFIALVVCYLFIYILIITISPPSELGHMRSIVSSLSFYPHNLAEEDTQQM